MAPMRVAREAVRLFTQVQKLSKPATPATEFGSAVYTKTSSGVLVPEHLNVKIKSSGKMGGWIDRAVDFLDLNVLGRIERLAWIQLRFGVVGVAVTGTAAAVKLSAAELFAPVPFAKYLSAEESMQPGMGIAAAEPFRDSTVITVSEEPSLNYQQMKAIAFEINGKLLDQFRSGVEEAIENGLVASFSRYLINQQRKFLANTGLTKEQKEEVEAALTRSLVLEFKKLSLKKKEHEEPLPSPAATEG